MNDEAAPRPVPTVDRDAQVAEFVRVVRLLTPRLLRTPCGLLREDLEDCLQTAFRRVYEQINAGTPIDNMEALIRTASKREIISGLRRRNNRKELTGLGGDGSDDDPDFESVVSTIRHAPDVAPGIIGFDCIERNVLPYFQKHDPRVLEAVLLSAQGYVGRSPEMMRATGMKSPASANDFLSKAWKRFKDKFDELCGDAPCSSRLTSPPDTCHD